MTGMPTNLLSQKQTQALLLEPEAASQVDVRFTEYMERFSTKLYQPSAASGLTVGHGIDFKEFKLSQGQLLTVLTNAIDEATVQGMWPTTAQSAAKWVDMIWFFVESSKLGKASKYVNTYDFAAQPGGLIVLQALETATYTFELGHAVSYWDTSALMPFDKLGADLKTLLFDITFKNGSIGSQLLKDLHAGKWTDAANDIKNLPQYSPPDRVAGWIQLIGATCTCQL
jgi:hypothetical protein